MMVFFMKTIYNENGIYKDFSDEGKQVAGFILEGYNQKEVANKLVLSEKTIQREMSVIKDKLSIIK